MYLKNIFHKLQILVCVWSRVSELDQDPLKTRPGAGLTKWIQILSPVLDLSVYKTETDI